MTGTPDMKDAAHETASLAIEAMLYEVSATPKPGLVDRNNCGAHKDMDFFTFMSSAAALHSDFDAMTQAGLEAESFAAMWPALQGLGLQAERRMFAATKGVNTHKGEIFSLGLLCGCAGWLLSAGQRITTERLTDAVSKLCHGLCERHFSGLHDKPEEKLTKGERVYLKYGCPGIRGEAESGYATVRKVSLPALHRLMGQGLSVNDALVQTLLYLIARTSDTNILARHGMPAAGYAREQAGLVLSDGGVFTEKGRRGIKKMDEDFIEKNISPGGCSDLLAVTYFLYRLEERL